MKTSARPPDALAGLVEQAPRRRRAVLVFDRLAGAQRRLAYVRETSARELVWVLYGTCAGVERVTLYPSSEVTATGSIGSVSADRKRFVSRIADGPALLSSGGQARATTLGAW